MKKIDIQITNAIIKSFSVELAEKKPEVSASIALLTAGGKEITTYTVSTSSWNDENKFELPISMMPPIIDIMKKMETVITKHCRENQLQLTKGE